MSLFVCSNKDCLTIDNTAPRCTACVTGRWHGQFEQRRYDPERDGPISEPGRLLLNR